jgi:hypothetical protein
VLKYCRNVSYPRKTKLSQLEVWVYQIESLPRRNLTRDRNQEPVRDRKYRKEGTQRHFWPHKLRRSQMCGRQSKFLRMILLWNNVLYVWLIDDTIKYFRHDGLSRQCFTSVLQLKSSGLARPLVPESVYQILKVFYTAKLWVNRSVYGGVWNQMPWSQEK